MKEQWRVISRVFFCCKFLIGMTKQSNLFCEISFSCQLYYVNINVGEGINKPLTKQVKRKVCPTEERKKDLTYKPTVVECVIEKE